MKQILLIVFVGFLIAFTEGAQAQEKRVSLSKLPVKAKQFLTTYYEKIDVASVKEEVESWFDKKEYEVKLEDGKKIEFDHHGNWKGVDGNRSAIPSQLVPESILQYVKRSFPRTEIIKLKKTTRKYEVAISNGLELEFNNKGEFIKIDD